MSLLHKQANPELHTLQEYDTSLPRRVIEAIGNTAFRTISLWHPKETSHTVLMIPVKPAVPEEHLLSHSSSTTAMQPNRLSRHEDNPSLVLYELLDFLCDHPELPLDTRERLENAAVTEAHALILERRNHPLSSSTFSAIDYPLLREAHELDPVDPSLREAIKQLRDHPPVMSDEYHTADQIATAIRQPFSDIYRRVVHIIDNNYDETAKDIPPQSLSKAKKVESAAERTQAS